jgi:phenylalanyl-tRNA synthetase beta chain
MKFSEKWLREWVDPAVDTQQLAHRLTMVGHEVDAMEPQGSGLDGVVVAEVTHVAKHPNADRLSVCQVSTGSESIEVVCGAPNVRAGMKSPFAPVGTKLPNGVALKRSKIRGVVSNGMLCSAIEIGLGDESDGIVELAPDALVGQSLADCLDLPDVSFDLDLTPNRGDCFSVVGIARDVSAMTTTPMKDAVVNPVAATIRDEHPVELVYPQGCPRFGARVIRNIDMSAESPLWMKERLRRSGLRSIHPVVDVTNYVMMEFGQPLHAYDLSRLAGPIRPRLAKRGEKLTLLDEKEVELLPNTLVIADDSGPIGMAGIMGGFSTMVTDATNDVFFEAAFFTPKALSGVARQYGMHTDASMRFERGVDPENQVRALERATQLLLEISGGEAGPVVDHCTREFLPASKSFRLRKSRLARVLGADIAGDLVARILNDLGLETKATGDGWQVDIPSYRFDIDVEDALVEEVARIFGYDEIPATTALGDTPLATVPEGRVDLEMVANTLVARDYQEVITYSFIDSELNALVTATDSELILSNPISSEMSVMRGSIWPGLLSAAAANLSRQQDRIRFFEIGKTFHGTPAEPLEVLRVAGILLGDVLDEQWGSKPQGIDFFDIKSDVVSILSMTGDLDSFDFVAHEHVILQPGQTAQIWRNQESIGVIGKLHPSIARQLDIERTVLLFELDAAKAFAANVPVAKAVSKYPTIRRDIAVVVKDGVTAAQLVEVAKSSAPALIQSVRIFDVYKGPGIEAGRKSVALGLILQETSRTLTDEDADTVMSAVLSKMQQDFGAELRE